MSPLKIFQGYPIYLSRDSNGHFTNKKYMADVDGRMVHFGDRNYEHFKDRIGYYSSQDHNDPERRKRYYERHPKDYPKGTADWFSKHVLW